MTTEELTLADCEKFMEDLQAQLAANRKNYDKNRATLLDAIWNTRHQIVELKQEKYNA